MSMRGRVVGSGRWPQVLRFILRRSCGDGKNSIRVTYKRSVPGSVGGFRYIGEARGCMFKIIEAEGGKRMKDMVGSNSLEGGVW